MWWAEADHGGQAPDDHTRQGAEGMAESLAKRVEEIPPRLLLPHGGPASHRLHLLDALALPASEPPSWIGLAVDDADRLHTLPLVDDALRPRRARAGDGWAASVVALGSVLESAGRQERGWRVRVVDAPDAESLLGALTEELVTASTRHEAVEVAGAYRVRLALEPQRVDAPVLQPWRHIAHTDPDLVSGGVLDVVWESEDGSYGLAPVVLVARVHDSASVAERLNREATRHLRGADTSTATLALAEALGSAVARAHLALALPSPECAEPTAVLDASGPGVLERRVKDVLSEAMVLTDPSVREMLSSHMAQLRASFAQLADAGGAVMLPPVSLGSLEQFVLADDTVTLDPLLVAPSPSPQLAVMDLARIFREVAHVAHGALRRMVNGGEDVPAERVPTWVGAVRDTVHDTYLAALHDAGQQRLFDERLLRAFEIEAECLALVYASRELPTWSAVPDAGLAELLTPW